MKSTRVEPFTLYRVSSRVLICAITSLALTGCHTYPKDYSWWGDSWRIGDAKAITANALQEKEFETIAQRICALAQLATGIPVLGKTPSQAQQRDAEAGLLTIEKRLVSSDWPIRFYNSTRREDDLRASLAGYTYFVCANFGVRREFYNQLRPAPNRLELVERWEKMLPVLEARQRCHIKQVDIAH